MSTHFVRFLTCTTILGSFIFPNSVMAQCNGGTTVTGVLVVSSSCAGGNIKGLTLDTGADVTINAGVTVSNDAPFGTNGRAVVILSTSTAANLKNNGTISTGNQWGLWTQSGSRVNVINTGQISASVRYGISNQGTINSLTNVGSITGPFSSIGNGSTLTGIGVFNNLQGQNILSSSPVTLAGYLPTQYNIIIQATNEYGQLSAPGNSGTMAFNIYGKSDTTLVAGVGASTVVANRYLNVLQGFTSLSNVTGTTGTYGGYTYSLVSNATLANGWDLLVAVAIPSTSTYRSNALSLRKMQASGASGVLDSLYANQGAMSGVITALDGLTGAAQANAIAQTLPVITGAASQATTSSMQALNQVIQGRSSSLRGMSSGDEYIGTRDVWMKGFGSWANQHDINGVSGYKINTGGLAIGIDKGLSRKTNIGAVFAFSNSGVSSNSSSAPSGVTVNSYQAGVYGDYAIHPQLIANAQVDIGMNQNNAYRNITFMGTNANSSYKSYSGHVGTGVKYLMPINPESTFIPSVRVDYTTVQSQAYTETGAGALNLSVGQQTYSTLIPSADLRIDHSLDSKLTLSANAGAGYNTLSNQATATSAYQGGGAVFATNGLQVSPWLYNAGVGITGQIEKNVQLNVRYDNVFSPTGYMNQMVSAKLKIPF
jgi:outer membrane autotransporter protein